MEAARVGWVGDQAAAPAGVPDLVEPGQRAWPCGSQVQSAAPLSRPLRDAAAGTADAAAVERAALVVRARRGRGEGEQQQPGGAMQLRRRHCRLWLKTQTLGR